MDNDPRALQVPAAVRKHNVQRRRGQGAESVSRGGRHPAQYRLRTVSEHLALDDLARGQWPGVEDDDATRRTLPAPARDHPTQSTSTVAQTGIGDGEDGLHGRHRRRVPGPAQAVDPILVSLWTRERQRPVWTRRPCHCVQQPRRPARVTGRPTCRPGSASVFQLLSERCPDSRMRPRPEGSPTEPAGAAARCAGASQSPHNGVPEPAAPPVRAARQARRAR